VRLVLLVTETAQDGESVDLREHEVEDDDIVLIVPRIPESSLTVAGHIDSVPASLQPGADRVLEPPGIFNKKDVHVDDSSTNGSRDINRESPKEYRTKQPQIGGKP